MKTMFTLVLATLLCNSCIFVIANGNDSQTTRRTKKHKTTQTLYTMQEQVPLATLHSITANMNIVVEYVQKDTTATAYITAVLPSDYKVIHSGETTGHFCLTLQGKKPRTSNDDMQVKVRVVAPTLDKVMLNTNASFYAKHIATPHLTINANTNASVRIDEVICNATTTIASYTNADVKVKNLRTPALDLTANTNAKTYIDEAICDATTTITSHTNADVEVKALRTPALDLTATTNATIAISALDTQALTANANTNADITLSGRATTAKLHETTSGSINQRKLHIGE